ncbi:LysE family translocator [Psychromonas sp. psych-6C06]|uniref:LysE family translocator n=1 Tax=Psychromonas sp. psych-6C06 TaxID=2058089 RepID=UPI000C336E6F|nr:LysE family translocator [Psychromonas sp. psych-6C06]PKF63782.1 LysE family translocator [Psychromonas sp. psych-6C06]
MISVLMSMFVFAFIGAISPGPVNIIATSSGASFGFKRTLPHVLGATIAYTLIVFVVGLGLSATTVALPVITEWLRYIGSAFLLYMAFKIATAVAVNTPKINVISQPPSAWQGALSQGLNPKAWLVSSSGVSIFVTTHSQPFFYLFIFCVVSFTLCLLGISTWAVMGHSIRGFLSTHKRQISFNILMALMLSMLVFTILLQ